MVKIRGKTPIFKWMIWGGGISPYFWFNTQLQPQYQLLWSFQSLSQSRWVSLQQSCPGCAQAAAAWCLLLTAKLCRTSVSHSGHPSAMQGGQLTPPKFNSLPLKNGIWKTIRLPIGSYWDSGNFWGGDLLNFGSQFHSFTLSPFRPTRLGDANKVAYRKFLDKLPFLCI